MTEDDLNRILAGIEVEWSDRAFCADGDLWFKCRMRGPEDDEATTISGLRYRHNVTVPTLIALEDAIVFAGLGRDVHSLQAIRDDWQN